MLSADRYSDVQQFFGTVADFGFSKTREESLEKWGHERVLADAVRVVRMTRPLVVTSTFVGGPTDGHGQHQVAGQVAQEAFQAAGDPSRFPEQIRAGLRPWSPLKMYARVPNRNEGRFFNYAENQWVNGPLSVQVRVPEGTYDPALGGTYLQIAREGLALQKSQNGGGRIPFAGPATVNYHRFASRVNAAESEQSYFDGIDISLAGIADLARGQDDGFLRAGLRQIESAVQRALNDFSLAQPEQVAPALAEGLKATRGLAERVGSSNLPEDAKYDVLYELRWKQQQFQQALAQALSLSLEAVVAPPQAGRGGGPGGPGFGAGAAETFAFAVPGQTFSVLMHLNNPTPHALGIKRLWVESPAGENWTITPESPVPAELAAGQALEQRFRVTVGPEAEATRPYFTRPNVGQPYYDIIKPEYIDLPLAPYPLSAWAELTYEGAEFSAGQVVQTARQENGPGLVLNPLMVAPAVSVKVSPQAGITPLDSKSFSLEARVRAEAEEGARGTLRLELPGGWRCDPARAAFSVGRAGQEQSVRFQVMPDRVEQKPYTVTAVAEAGGRQYREGFTTVGYAMLRPYNLYQPSAFRTSGVDVKVSTGLRIGYVMGTGDAVPESLKNLGVQPEFLSAQDIAQGELEKYDTIVLGIRAYDARPELARFSTRLLDYVNQGGALVVQYHFGRTYGPYPFSLPPNPGGDTERVVDETAPVRFLEPQSPILNWPNKISAKDFEGWISGRGNGFMISWDEHYQAVLETHDSGQEPQRGGLMYARYGRGVFVYTALSLYRQLPEGVPGAYRIFANLLSLPKNPGLQMPKLRGGPVRPALPQR